MPRLGGPRVRGPRVGVALQPRVPARALGVVRVPAPGIAEHLPRGVDPLHLGVVARHIGVEDLGEDAIHATAVLDLSTGEAAWRDRGAEALLVGAGIVVTSTGSAETTGRLEGRAVGSGQLRWNGSDDTRAAAGVGSTDETVVVVREESVFGSTAVLSLSARTGRLRSASMGRRPRARR